MTNYELLFVIDSTLDDEQKNATVEQVQNIITENGTLGETDVWGMRKLAYPIEKKNEGYYVLVNFQAEADFPKELDRRLKISDAVVRHIIINKDAK